MIPTRYTTKALYTGQDWLKDVVVHVENGVVVSIDKKDFKEADAVPFIVPALIDLQLYGASGQLLSEMPTKETIEKNRVRVNDQITKPSYEVKPQDIIDIYFKDHTVKIRVLNPIQNYETIPQPKPTR